MRRVLIVNRVSLNTIKDLGEVETHDAYNLMQAAFNAYKKERVNTCLQACMKARSRIGDTDLIYSEYSQVRFDELEAAIRDFKSALEVLKDEQLREMRYSSDVWLMREEAERQADD